MEGATVKPTKPSQNVIPAQGAFSQYPFAFSHTCDKSCADDQFGARSLSSSGGAFFAIPAAANTFSKAILTAMGTLVHDFEVDRYLLIDYEEMDIQAAIMRANLPLARIFIFIPPCTTVVAAALAVCRKQECDLTEWRVRVDHRLDCACCKDTASALKRIEMIADTIADVESGNHRAKPETTETRWIAHIDRAWLEQILYNEEEDILSSASKKDDNNGQDYAGIRQMLTNNGRNRDRTVAVIVADVDNAG